MLSDEGVGASVMQINILNHNSEDHFPICCAIKSTKMRKHVTKIAKSNKNCNYQIDKNQLGF